MKRYTPLILALAALLADAAAYALRRARPDQTHTAHLMTIAAPILTGLAVGLTLRRRWKKL